ncbi:unnamed protein product [Rotaria sp. Silwood2]|nr:unnamed protein product [Rotaria sp. Silwood2]
MVLVKRCILNRFKLCGARLKNYVRQQNVHFNLNDIQQLCNECLSVCGLEHAAGYFAHVDKHEEICKAAEKNAEELENDLIDSDNNIDHNALNNDDDDDDDDNERDE